MNEHRQRSRYKGWTPSDPNIAVYMTHPFTGVTTLCAYTEYRDCWKAFEEIHDTTGFIKSYFNPCYHIHVNVGALKGISSVYAEPYVFGPGGPKLTKYSFSKPIVSESAMIGNTYYFGKPSDQWLSDFGARAQQSLTEAAPLNASVVNTLIEMLQLVEGNIGKALDLTKILSKAYKAALETFTRTGNIWLAWRFGIRPMLKDVKDILNSINAAQKRLNYLRAVNHSDTIARFRDNPLEFSGSTDWVGDVNLELRPEPGYEGIIPEWLVLAYRVQYRSKWSFAAHGLVRFEIPDDHLGDLSGPSYIWNDMQGLYNPLAIVWEAIPYSWLVDWFVNQKTQLQLEIAEISPLPDATLIQSMHGKRQECIVNMLQIGDGIPATGLQLGTYIVDTYRRMPGLPDPEVFPFRIPLEWYKASILAALMDQKFRR